METQDADEEVAMADAVSKSSIVKLVNNSKNKLKSRTLDKIQGSMHDGFLFENGKQSIEIVRKNLNGLIVRRLDAIRAETKVKIQRPRPLHQQEDFLENRTAFFENETEQLYIHCDIFPSKPIIKPFFKTCLYDDLDLYDAVRAASIPECKPGLTLWSALSLPICTDSLETIQLRFPHLSPSIENIGLHDIVLDGSAIQKSSPSFLDSKIELGKKLLEDGTASNFAEFAKTGVPATIRPQVWKLMLQSDVYTDEDPQGQRTTYSLNQEITAVDLLMDRIVHLDAKHCQNDDSYFVFEDVVRDMLLLMVRDANWLVENTVGYSNQDRDQVYPIWGISLYAMPVCFLYSSANEAYMLFRELYVRYFCRLHSIDYRKGTLIELCALFENLLKQKDPELFFYLAFDMDIQPLDVAFKWIVYAFVGVLDIDEVLLMFDRIIAYDDLNIIPLTAAALMHYRKDMIMKCQTAEEVRLCFSETGVIKWAPLVIDFLHN